MQKDMDFVHKVFVPLLKTEKSIPVTISPAVLIDLQIKSN